MVEVAVVILNYNGAKFLSDFIPGVLNHLPSYAQLFVIDNASSDNSKQVMMNQFSSVEVIQLSENLGFTGGYNEGLKKINAKYYILLNSDIEIKSNWIEPLYEHMERHPNVGICQPKIKDQKNNAFFEYAGAAGGFIDYLGYPFCRGRIFQELEKDNGQYNDPCTIFWSTGAAMFIRSELYHQLEGLDKDFFAHMEEIDLCWRAQHLGYEVHYIGKSEVYHVGGGTLPKNNPRKAYYNFRNNLMMLIKNLPKSKLLPIVIFRLILDGIAGVKFLFEGDYKQTIAVIKAHFYIYFHLGSILRKRKRIKQTQPSTIHTKSIVIQHYVKGIKFFTDL